MLVGHDVEPLDHLGEGTLTRRDDGRRTERRAGLGALEEVGVVADLAQLHQDVEQPHAVRPAERVERRRVLREQLRVPETRPRSVGTARACAAAAGGREKVRATRVARPRGRVERRAAKTRRERTREAHTHPRARPARGDARARAARDDARARAGRVRVSEQPRARRAARRRPRKGGGGVRGEGAGEGG